MAGAGVKVRVDAHPEADPQEMADLSGSLVVYAGDVYNLAESVGLELIHAGWQYHGKYEPFKPTLFVDLRFADSRRKWSSTQPEIWRVIPNWDWEKRRFLPRVGLASPGSLIPTSEVLPTPLGGLWAETFALGLRQILTGVIAEVQRGYWNHCQVQEMIERQALDKVNAFDPVGARLFAPRPTGEGKY